MMGKNKMKIDGLTKIQIKDLETKVKDLYGDKADYEKQLAESQEEINKQQEMLYADPKHGVLIIFQAMDAAGKDGTMAAVFKNVHPLGLSFKSFKRPTEPEIAHDYLWRCYQELPERGHIKVFNRSYYEEVLVVKVHPEIITNVQKLPEELKADKNIWEKRYEDIRGFETYLHNNGIVVIKFFLHVSKQEQAKRLIERIEDKSKNWKFDENDIKERGYWDAYQEAFEEMINQTATIENPWNVIPADDKKNMRLMVAEVIVERLKDLNLKFPDTGIERAGILEEIKKGLLKEI